MIYIDADERLTTWGRIATAGNYQLYRGNAQSGDVIIRWGANHSHYQGRYPNGVRVLNPKLVLSKVDQAHLFQQSGVPIPLIFWTRRAWELAGNPTVVRKEDISQMGTGMILTTAPYPERHPNRLYQQYIEKEREFRAMMVKEMVAFLMEKHAPANQDFRWNEHRGSEWTSVPTDRNLRIKLKEIGKKALDAVQYDFGAVDIIKKGNDLLVLEVNSRPEFGQTNAERFVRAIESCLRR